ncbi:MAG: 6,7-dimethyl-8-ribityllumazine synthase [Opitutaceae bacterium]|nr:6,7-dimethyl-8-ribityllumazine synthase [Opitutaceae bacterium]
MSLQAPQENPIDGRRLAFGIVAARYNAGLVDALLDTVQARLAAAGVKPKAVRVVRVPGSHEVPVAAQWLARAGGRDAVIALGVLVGGDTRHHEMVGESVSHALQRVALDTRVPVINGVIVADTLAQAEARCVGAINRGAEFARAALEMAELGRGFRRKS